VDNLMMYDGSGWVDPLLPPYNLQQYTGKNYSFKTDNGKFYISNNYSVSVYDNALNKIRYIDYIIYNNPSPRDAMIDKTGIMWIADFDQGLVRLRTDNSYNFIYPNGPQSELVSGMAVEKSHLWVTHASRNAGWFNTYTSGNASDFVNSNWKTYNKSTVPNAPINIDDFYDMMSVAIDPDNSNHAFLGSKGQGLLEMLDGYPINSYRENNSTLQVGIGNPTQCQVVGMGFDKNKNLWVLNSLAAKPVNVKTPDGNWSAFSIPGIPGAPLFGDMTIDSYGQKWINVIGNNSPLGAGIAVFDDNGTFDDETDDRSRFITSGIGKGNLPSTDIRAITEDKENEIWIGTGKGVCVIYSPSSVITSNNFDAQQILIKQDGINQYLLESEVVTAIAVDGANRKWIGTESGGVFLMAADGTKQIVNFNESNSPLLSNFILAISIDQKTGEVFIGTNKGLISYKGDAIDGEGGCNNVLAYPNPVRENYNGPIAIKGLVPNGNVKITDVSGNIVYETKANGTQALWYGKNFKGEKAHTGVYLVFSSDEEGENTCVTKLLFIN
ncbi:MAG TPA: two-component regulator propeller domain-containing protein, partial [Bacteroidia bacterium]|nr:two-component regulator propeller domain-containing protein [Bacteroidia bacterium]